MSERVTPGPRPTQAERSFAWPHLVIRHVVVGGATVLVVVALALAFDAPLKELANPNMTPTVSKAPWYFAGLQELLAYMHPMIAGVIAPAAALVFVTLLPYLDRSSGRRLRDRKVVTVIFFIIVLAAIVLTVIGSAFRGPEWRWVWPWDHLYLEL